MKIRATWILLVISMLLLSSCGKFEDIKIHGLKDFKLRGMKNGRILINLTLDIENPNNRKITISNIHFKAWLNNRELGTLKNSKKIVLLPNTREEHEVPVEIVLRTVADAFKLMTLKGDILNQLTIEGYIKGRTMCISKKIKIEKQPFTQLVKSYKRNLEPKDSLQTMDSIPQKDSLRVE
jgi:LEA14-like dessication related protein